MQCSENETNPKPINLFYIWYAELCRRFNSAPAMVVKPARPKCQTVLDFVADRIKIEEWNPIVKALKHDTSLHVIIIKSRLDNCRFLHEIDTEDKLKQLKRRAGSLWTAFILKSLLKSLCCTLKNTPVLTFLELDGLPIFTQYLDPLLRTLPKNKTLKSLSLTRCPIKDEGCEMVCDCLKYTPNIEILNLSSCDLASESGKHLSKLIKYQQINRYCETWHQSLRYTDPDVQVMCGLKRIILNGNHNFGDEGLDHIINELADDLWIKALDLQKCGITNNLTEKIFNMLQYNQSLEIIDLRQNEQLSSCVMENILSILQTKLYNKTPEFQWCNTALSLACESFYDPSIYTTRKNVPKAKSVPTRNNFSNISLDNTLRRTKSVQEKSKLKASTEKKIFQSTHGLDGLSKEGCKRNQSESTIKLKTDISQEPRKNLNSRNLSKKCLNPCKSENVIEEKASKVTSNNVINDLKSVKVNSSTPSLILERLINYDDNKNDSDVESLLGYVEQDEYTSKTTTKMKSSLKTAKCG